MLRNLLITTLNLLLFRAGPQDLPYEPRLTSLLVSSAALVQYAISVMVMPAGLAAAMAIALVMGLALSTQILLRIRSVEARFMQTYHALLAVSAVMSLLSWIPLSEIAPALVELSKRETPPEPGTDIGIASGPLMLMFVLMMWNFFVNAAIYRHAANLGYAAGLLVALLVSVGVQMFVLFFASAAAAIFGVAPATGS